MMGQFRKVLATMAFAVAAAFGGNGATPQDASTWDTIRDRGTLRIGVTQAPPWYLNNPAEGTWSGLGLLIGTAMAET